MLFARSGNRCAFPKCRAPMAVNETSTGEVRHIKGARPGSARYDPRQPDVERHAYANLVPMCPTHHTVIDDDEEAYTVERLCKIKAAHESQSVPIPDAEAAAVAEVIYTVGHEYRSKRRVVSPYRERLDHHSAERTVHEPSHAPTSNPGSRAPMAGGAQIKQRVQPRSLRRYHPYLIGA